MAVRSGRLGQALTVSFLQSGYELGGLKERRGIGRARLNEESHTFGARALT